MDDGKTQWTRSQVRASVPLMRKRYKRVDPPQKICNHSIGGIETILGDEIPNPIEIKLRLRMKIVARHDPGVDRRAALFSRKRARTSSPGTGFTLPLFKSS